MLKSIQLGYDRKEKSRYSITFNNYNFFDKSFKLRDEKTMEIRTYHVVCGDHPGILTTEGEVHEVGDTFYRWFKRRLGYQPKTSIDEINKSEYTSIGLRSFIAFLFDTRIDLRGARRRLKLMTESVRELKGQSYQRDVLEGATTVVFYDAIGAVQHVLFYYSGIRIYVNRDAAMLISNVIPVDMYNIKTDYFIRVWQYFNIRSKTTARLREIDVVKLHDDNCSFVPVEQDATVAPEWKVNEILSMRIMNDFNHIINNCL